LASVKHLTEITSFSTSWPLQSSAMNPPIRTCYLFDEFGQQVGPFTVGETLRHLESAERQPGFRPRRLTVWTLGWPTRLNAAEARTRLRQRLASSR
jgi:hypothetical protein